MLNLWAWRGLEKAKSEGWGGLENAKKPNLGTWRGQVVVLRKAGLRKQPTTTIQFEKTKATPATFQRAPRKPQKALQSRKVAGDLTPQSPPPKGPGTQRRLQRCRRQTGQAVDSLQTADGRQTPSAQAPTNQPLRSPDPRTPTVPRYPKQTPRVPKKPKWAKKPTREQTPRAADIAEPTQKLPKKPPDPLPQPPSRRWQTAQRASPPKKSESPPSPARTAHQTPQEPHAETTKTTKEAEVWKKQKNKFGGWGVRKGQKTKWLWKKPKS